MIELLKQKAAEVWDIVKDQFAKYPELRLAVLSLIIALASLWFVVKVIF